MSGKHGADLSRLPLDLRAGGVWLMSFGCAQIGSRWLVSFAAWRYAGFLIVSGGSL
jgi:hypothetical protein